MRMMSRVILDVEAVLTQKVIMAISSKETLNKFSMANLVAIVGRPNVGKSTLFNRLTKTRHAIVSDEAGTTRDRQYGKCEWGNKEFSVVDTGGWVVNSDDVFEEEIRRQVLIAIEECDVILFLVDVKVGVTDLDMAVANILRRSKIPTFLVSNKVDSNELRYDAAEFYSLSWRSLLHQFAYRKRNWRLARCGSRKLYKGNVRSDRRGYTSYCCRWTSKCW